jgi:hypothetical protein
MNRVTAVAPVYKQPPCPVPARSSSSYGNTKQPTAARLARPTLLLRLHVAAPLPTLHAPPSCPAAAPSHVIAAASALSVLYI